MKGSVRGYLFSCGLMGVLAACSVDGTEPLAVEEVTGEARTASSHEDDAARRGGGGRHGGGGHGGHSSSNGNSGWGGWGYGGGVGMSSETTTSSTYTEGTLIIDAWDAQEKKMVWRGTGTVTIKAKPEKQIKQVEKILTKIGAKWDKILHNRGK